MRAVKSSPGPIGAASLKDVFSPGLELNGFFVALTLTVLRTKASTPDCGGAEEKRFSLTQGERLREGCAPSDKRPDRLTIGRGRDEFSGSINKAAQHIKGRTPMWTTCD